MWPSRNSSRTPFHRPPPPAPARGPRGFEHNTSALSQPKPRCRLGDVAHCVTSQNAQDQQANEGHQGTAVCSGPRAPLPLRGPGTGPDPGSPRRRSRDLPQPRALSQGPRPARGGTARPGRGWRPRFKRRARAAAAEPVRGTLAMEAARDYAGALIRRVPRQPGSGGAPSPPPPRSLPRPAPRSAPRPRATHSPAARALRTPLRPPPPSALSGLRPRVPGFSVSPSFPCVSRPPRARDPAAPLAPRNPSQPTRAAAAPVPTPSGSAGRQRRSRPRLLPLVPRPQVPGAALPRRAASAPQVTAVSAGAAEVLAAAAAAAAGAPEDPFRGHPGDASTVLRHRASGGTSGSRRELGRCWWGRSEALGWSGFTPKGERGLWFQGEGVTLGL